MSQISSKISSGEKGQHKDAIKDTTSDSQVNSCFPHRWPPAGLTLNICFYLFLYQYITRITVNNGTPHLKPPKNQNRRAALGRPAIKLMRDLNSFMVDQPSLLALLWFTKNKYEQQKQNEYNTSKKTKRAAGGHNTRITCKTDTTAMKQQ